MSTAAFLNGDSFTVLKKKGSKEVIDYYIFLN